MHEVPAPPEALTACAPRPAVAALPADPTGQAYLLARLLIASFAAGDDCRATLGELVAWLRDAAAQVETRRAP